MGTDCPDFKVGCFLGITLEQLLRVIEQRDLGNPNTVVIHVGTNDIKRTKNLYYVMGDIYELISMAKSKYSSSRVILSAVIDRLEWVANSLGVTFVDPKCWVDNSGFT